MDSSKVQLLALSQVKVNADNPRTISGEKFQKLINSILVFPKMMELRPVVINSQFVALGGNMRTNALNAIAKMQPSDIASRLEQLRDYQKLTSGEKDALKKYWGAWVKKPTVHAVKADTLSPTEQQQFIVKDNVSFGTWDFDALANKFDERDLGDWGMDIWQPTEFVSSPSAPVGSVPTQQPNYPADSEDDGVLPPELQGLNLEPNALPNIQGNGETNKERIIIVFDNQQRERLAQLIGVAAIDRVIFDADDLLMDM
jgi:hypothetical protein